MWQFLTAIMNIRRPCCVLHAAAPELRISLRFIDEVTRTSSADLPDGRSPAIRCPVPVAKIFLFSPKPNHFYIAPRPVPQEGRHAIVTDAGRDAVDADGADNERRLRRTAKSCGPGAPTLASSS